MLMEAEMKDAGIKTHINLYTCLPIRNINYDLVFISILCTMKFKKLIKIKIYLNAVILKITCIVFALNFP